MSEDVNEPRLTPEDLDTKARKEVIALPVNSLMHELRLARVRDEYLRVDIDHEFAKTFQRFHNWARTQERPWFEENPGASSIDERKPFDYTYFVEGTNDEPIYLVVRYRTANYARGEQFFGFMQVVRYGEDPRMDPGIKPQGVTSFIYTPEPASYLWNLRNRDFWISHDREEFYPFDARDAYGWFDRGHQKPRGLFSQEELGATTPEWMRKDVVFRWDEKDPVDLVSQAERVVGLLEKAQPLDRYNPQTNKVEPIKALPHGK